MEQDTAAFYRSAAAMGLEYGPSFRGIERLWGAPGAARGEIAAPESVAGPGAALHPAVLDACLQVIGAALPPDSTTGDPYVPLAWEAIEIRAAAPRRIICDVRLRAAPNARTLIADLWLQDPADGSTFACIRALTLKRASRRALLKALSGNDDLLHQLVWPDAALPAPGAPPLAGCWLLLGDGCRTAALAAALTAEGATAMVAAEADTAAAVRTALDAAAHRGTPVSGIAWLAGTVGAPDAREAEAALAPVLSLAQVLIDAGVSLPQGLAIVTDGAVATQAGEDAAPVAATLWGFGRSLQSEQPALRPRLIDVVETEMAALAGVLLADASEPQLARRGGAWLAPRLLRRSAAGRLMLPGVQAARLEVGAAQTLEALQLVAAEPPTPDAGQVTLAVSAAGVNFRDVLNALGLYPGDAGPLGGECAGVVTAVGAGVSHMAPGDRVFGFAPGAFATSCTTSAQLLRRLPGDVDPSAAATMPTTFSTALAAFDLAALRAGQRVLIHAGAGGVGMAAIQVAQSLGAEVFATASAAKRDAVRALGVRHVFDSRSTSFAAEILAATEGHGVDVILNSLTSPGFIEASLSALAPGGRLVEIAKRGIWTQQAMASVRPDVGYHILALDDWMRDEPERVGALLDRILAGIAAGHMQPLPRRCYALTDASAAMRLMQRGEHVGKVVLRVDYLQPRPDGSYLVTGGLGALGVSTAEFLAQRGAGRVVLAARRGPDAETEARLAEIAAQTGCRIETVQLDVSDAASVHALIARLADAVLPLRGVIHAAGVLDDGTIPTQSWDRFARVLAPKLLGAWHLHQATIGLNLEFFVLYSSIAGVLGSAGQSNYAAANAALDALAAHRQSLGLPATSVAWGPWGAGMAGSDRARAQLAHGGLQPLAADAAYEALGAVLRDGAAAGVVVDADWSRMGRLLAEVPPMLSGLVEAPGQETMRQEARGALAAQLAGMLPTQRRDAVLAWLAAAVQGVLNLPTPPAADVGFSELGMDSLMAVELRNQLNAELRLDPPLPATVLFDHPALGALADAIVPRLALPGSDSASAETSVAVRYSPLLSLNRGRQERPLFCIHSATGLGLEFGPLAEALPEQVPIWALAAKGMNDGDAFFASIPEMVDTYVRAIRDVQPTGPYQLAGYSFGGIVAHAVAVRLEAAGEDVSMLTVIDSLVPGFSVTGQAAVDAQRKLDLLEALDDAELHDRTAADGLSFAHLPPGLVRVACRHFRHVIALLRDYRPTEACRAPIVLFRATERVQEASLWPTSVPAEAFAWSSFTSGEVTEVPIAATHLRMLQHTQAAEIAQHLTERLLVPA